MSGSTRRSFPCAKRQHRACPGGWHDGPWEPCACPCHRSPRQPGDTDWADTDARGELARLKDKGVIAPGEATRSGDST